MFSALISVPFSSGHTMFRARGGRHRVQARIFQSPSHRGTQCFSVQSPAGVSKIYNFSPLLIGAHNVSLSYFRFKLCADQISVPFSSGHTMFQCPRAIKPRLIANFSPLLIGAHNVSARPCGTSCVRISISVPFSSGHTMFRPAPQRFRQPLRDFSPLLIGAHNVSLRRAVNHRH